jgi:hypothetical protein
MGREKSRPLPSLARSDIDSSLGLALRPTLLLPVRFDQPKLLKNTSDSYSDSQSDVCLNTKYLLRLRKTMVVLRKETADIPFLSFFSFLGGLEIRKNCDAYLGWTP